ncbi:protein-L-isoaspartate O-methyltransferase [Halococcus morrhuae DSM 1307]|uniref:Protein-L-isoaspartate O-methyltransferase n=1 Tax=Halococcus morrhuae DSM 1307 TaxID=931277 RepID=M0MTH6_HALMO|nr:protein-L-isoaspartate(D-aspartate) O-methyltransferase [Halococcus morrhuae]EMA48931.1 protein-L-isoaspartate O-methyltransferase [Halococcus morrhuae DSM 1307]
MDHERARERLVARLDEQGRIERDATREALLAVPRHEFVAESRRKDAYDDRPLPIGADQTISAPHMVAIMSDLLAPEANDSILEIGTGCGYHAAVTAAIAGDVKSIEYHASLAENARERLSELGYTVDIRVGDGHDGWPEHAPYDGAYLTCAAPEIPEAVAEQVRPGGAIVAPIGTRRQTLVRARRRADGSLDRTEHGGVRFVPMQG